MLLELRKTGDGDGPDDVLQSVAWGIADQLGWADSLTASS